MPHKPPRWQGTLRSPLSSGLGIPRLLFPDGNRLDQRVPPSETHPVLLFTVSTIACTTIGGIDIDIVFGTCGTLPNSSRNLQTSRFSGRHDTTQLVILGTGSSPAGRSSSHHVYASYSKPQSAVREVAKLTLACDPFYPTVTSVNTLPTPAPLFPSPTVSSFVVRENRTPPFRSRHPFTSEDSVLPDASGINPRSCFL